MFLIDNITVRTLIMLASHFQYLVAVDKLPWEGWIWQLKVFYVETSFNLNDGYGHVKIWKI